MTKYKVYHKSTLLGETVAVSAAKAINNMRFRCNRRYAPMSEFTVKEV